LVKSLIAMDENIRLRGVRVHNLKNIDLDVPLYRLIIVTGVSGSGKSSLAFDTLYAEGQRRYIESLSAYARQFLERMDKPDADLIEGITPAIAIQQKAATKNPRSTVATVTEIHDFLRVLFARIGVIHCLKCGRPVRRDTIDAVVETLLGLPGQPSARITFSWPLEKGTAVLRKEGFFRIVLDNRVVELGKARLPKKGALEVFVDELDLDPADRERLVDSLEIGLKKGDGRIKVRTADGREFVFSEKLECKTDHILYEEPFPNMFSFNSPQGACPECHGFGDVAVLDEEKIIPDKSLTLAEGAVEPWTKRVARWWRRELLKEAARRGVPTDVPYRRLSPEQQRFVREGGGSYEGTQGFFDWLQTKKYKLHVRVFLSRYRKYVSCPACGGTRLNPNALSVKIKGRSIGDVARMTVKEAAKFFGEVELEPFERQVAEKLIAEIQGRLKFLLEVGLDYIALDRMTFTLSGGEAQRINLAAALSASLVGTLFVLDEPSVGLHARDNHRLVEILKSLKDIGNTVLVVEHDPEIIKAGEYLVDLGPGAGEGGGRVLFAGPMDEFLRQPDSLTARYLRGEKEIEAPARRRKGAGYVEIKGASKHNLKDINVRIPLGVMTCVTGVSGSGKSTLLHDVLYLGWDGRSANGFKEIRGRELIDKLIMVDQSPLSTSPRSIPATYTKAMDGIRDLFSKTREAKALGFKPGFFSFNTPGGRCEACKGAGQTIVEMQFLSDVVLTCDACKGKRFRSDVLEVKYKDKNIDEVLSLSVTEAMAFFADRPDILKKLAPLREVGLGYLRMGQPTTTLSGGELQRIKLAYHLVHEREKRILYLFYEPTIGLHMDDVSVLLRCFQKLVAEGHSVVVIEHNLDVIKCADHVIDLGPEGGEAGGRVVAAGTPEAVAAAKDSITGRYLKPYLKKSAAL
jgi:excinuclease ABC subunit A